MSINPQNYFSKKASKKIDDEATAWLAKRDRGLTPQEQDMYLQWLRSDERHAQAMKRHAAVLERMMQLYAWQPGQSANPNADLFKPKPLKSFFTVPLSLAAVAAVLVLSFVGLNHRHQSSQAIDQSKSFLKVNEVMVLPDGSRVELKDGSNVIVHFSNSERRVRLTGGEAQFKVWKDSKRPFYVEVAGIEVRAVGTAFNVKLDGSAVEVLVTEGKVKVLTESSLRHENITLVPMLTAGEKAVVQLPSAFALSHSTISPVSPEEMSQQLDWQAPRLNFHETPMADAVAEFNRLNQHRQIVISDPSLNSIKIGGTFRSDNVEGFVRLLRTTLDIKSDVTADGNTSLRR